MKVTKYNSLLFIMWLALGWRVMLLAVSFCADFFLPYAPTFPYANDILATFAMPRWYYSFANFDGVHYLTIIAKGYVGTGLIQAFFPLYPLLARSVAALGVSNLHAGLIVANASLIAFLVALYTLAKIDFSSSRSRFIILVTVLFPTSFFFGSLYSESLFLLLAVSAFIFARKKQWIYAGLLTALATATRVVGIALVPALILEIYQTYASTSLRARWQKRDFHGFISSGIEVLSEHKGAVASVLLGVAGLLGYMIYLHLTFGDAFYFLHVQAEFGANRSESLVTYPQVVWRYFKILLTARPFNWAYYAWVQEFVAGTLGLVALLAGIGRVRASYLLFALGAFIIPTLTGTFSSMPRYVLVCFPLYFIVGRLQLSKGQRLSYLAISTALLIINTILFVQGFWVA